MLLSTISSISTCALAPNLSKCVFHNLYLVHNNDANLYYDTKVYSSFP